VIVVLPSTQWHSGQLVVARTRTATEPVVGLENAHNLVAALLCT